MAINVITSAAVTLAVLGLVWSGYLDGRSSPSGNGGFPAVWTQLTSNEELSIEEVASRAAPATVSISAIREGGEGYSERQWWFEWFDEGERPSERIVGSGSGFFISSDGHIVTNRHVVEGASRLTVTRHDNKTYEADIIMLHPELDLAVIDIDGQDFPALDLAKERVRVGQSVIAIGNALSEFSNSVSVGIVSGTERSIVAADSLGRQEALDHLIQTDAAINPGNSGGPLLDRRGRVVGVNVAIAEGYENIGFALPATLISRALEPYMEN